MMQPMNSEYEYIKALHERFCNTSDMATETQAEWEKAHEILHANLGRRKRRLLLAMNDAHGLVVECASLESFAIGLRLGLGISQELGTYSYDNDVEQRIIRQMEKD